MRPRTGIILSGIDKPDGSASNPCCSALTVACRHCVEKDSSSCNRTVSLRGKLMVSRANPPLLTCMKRSLYAKPEPRTTARRLPRRERAARPQAHSRTAPLLTKNNVMAPSGTAGSARRFTAICPTATRTANQKPVPWMMHRRMRARRSPTGATGMFSVGTSANSGTMPARISGTRDIFTKGWITSPCWLRLSAGRRSGFRRIDLAPATTRGQADGG